MQRTRKSWKLKAAVCLPTLLAGAVAVAGLHFVSAVKCVVRSGPAAEYDASARLWNPGASPQILICPGDTLDLGTAVAGKVSVIDSSSTDRICCSVRTRNANSGILTTGTDACTGFAEVVSEKILVPGDSGGISGSFNYHWIQCYVPGTSAGSKSGVTAYRVADI